MDGLVCTVAPRGHAAAHAGAQDFARTQLVGILEAGGAAGAHLKVRIMANEVAND